MSYSEKDKVGVIPGVGEVVQSALERLGIFTIADLLRWFPRQYLDAAHPLPVSQVPYGRLSAVQVTVDSTTTRPTKNRALSLFEAKCSDDSGVISVRWFNQTYLKQKLTPGSTWIFIGEVNRFQGEVVMMNPIIETRPYILSFYAQTKGVTSRLFRGFLDWVLHQVTLDPDRIPEDVKQEAGIIGRQEALSSIHQPKEMAEVVVARRRLAFEEVFWFFVRMASTKQETQKERGIPLSLDVEYLKTVVAALPFELTPGQKRAVWDIVQEMATGSPMTRLLNGDVGAGKTVVAALAASQVAKSGYQTILLVPTEILAKQHFESTQRLFAGLGFKVVLWTAAQKDLGVEDADLIVGTHAVLQEGFSLPRLGLVVIDEQHRFGVRQRSLLRQGQAVVPHVLSMTATPIPRTLALALYGDLTVSVLSDKPKNRLPIITQIIHESARAQMHARIMEELREGHQVFVICPLIEEKTKKKVEPGEGAQLELTDEELEKEQKKTVVAEAERLRSEHPEYGVIEVIHGKMKPQEKRDIMDRMARGEIHVLVATSVIEVGVDIPNATVMIIEGAERFGLAALHQFRGRIGRGSAQSYCFLCPTLRGRAIDERLQVLVNTNSGFQVAEQDLALRGPGELTGNVQSGLPDFRMTSLTDLTFLQEVKEVADRYIQNHPDFLESVSDIAYSTHLGGLE